MSNSIDSRVVQMNFDNKQFEAGVQTTLKSLEKMDKKLKMTDGTTGLENVGKAMKNMKMDPAIDSVQKLTDKFSVLNTVAFTAVTRATNAAIDMGTRLAKAVTIGPAIDGYNEYKTKLDAIKVIQANVGDNVTNSDIKNTLAELNTYADKTIYNFGDMTTAIGKFTNAGADLKQSATAIKGLANIAAGSGTDPTRLAGAYTQIAQALQSGKFQAIDWMSMLTANLSSPELQRRLTETGKAMGHARDETVSFKDSLKSGWLTSEVFLKVMEQAADDTNEWGAKLTIAATQVRDFHQMIDVMKEDIGSGWATTWELIIGDSEEAAEWFTHLSMFFSRYVLGPMTDSRNQLLQAWHDMGGHNDVVFGINWGLISIQKALSAVASGFRYMIPPMTATTLKNLTQKFEDFTKGLVPSREELVKFKKIGGGFGAVFGIITDALKAVLKHMDPVYKAIGKFNNKALDVFAGLGTKLMQLRKWEQESKIFDKAVNRIVQGYTKFAAAAKHAGELIKEALGLTNFSFKDIKIPDSWSKFGGDFKSKVGDVLASVKEELNRYYDAFMNFHFDEPLLNIGEGIKKFFEALNKANPEKGKNAASIKSLKEGFKSAKEAMGGGIDEFVDRCKELFDKITKNLDEQTIDKVKKILLAAAGVVGVIATFILRFQILLAFKQLIKAATGMCGSIGMFFQSMVGMFQTINKAAKDFVKAKKKEFKANNFLKYAQGILIIVGAIAALAASFKFIGVGETTAALFSVGAIMIIMIAVFKQFDKLTTMADGTAKDASSINALSGMLLSFSLLIFVIGGKVATLAKVAQRNTEGFAYAIAGIMAILVALAMVATYLGNNFNPSDAETVKMATKVVRSLAGALFVISFAVAIIGGMSLGGVLKGVGSVVATMTAIGIVLSAILHFSKLSEGETSVFDKVGKTFTKIGEAMILLTFAIRRIGSMDWQSGLQGVGYTALLLGVMGGIVVALLHFSKVAEGDSSDFENVGEVFTKIGVTMILLSFAVKRIGSMDWQSGLQGTAYAAILLGVMGLIVIKLVEVSKVAEGDESVFENVGDVFQKIGLTMILLSFAVKRIGEMDFASALQGVAGVGLLLVGMGLLLKKMTDWSKDADSEAIDAFSNAMLKMAASVAIIGVIVKMVGAIPFEDFAQGMGMFIITMAAFAGVGYLVDKFPAMGAGLTEFAKGMLIASAAMLVLMIPLKEIGKMKFEDFAQGMAAFVISLGALAGIGALATPAATGILALGGAILMIGVAVLAAGIGFDKLGAGMLKIADAMRSLQITFSHGSDAIAHGLVVVGEAVATVIPDVIKAIAKGIVEFAEVIIAGAETIGAAFAAVGVAILSAIRVLIPQLAETGTVAIITFLNAIVQRTYFFVAAGILIVSEIMHGLADAMPQFIKSGMLMTVKFLMGLADAIRKYGWLIEYAIQSLFEAILEAMIDGLELLVGGIPGIGDKAVAGLEKAKKGLHDVMLPEEMEAKAKATVEKLDQEVTDGENKLKQHLGNMTEEVSKGGDDMAAVAEEKGAGIPQGYIAGATSADSKAALAMMARQTKTEVAENLKDEDGEIYDSGYGNMEQYFDGAEAANLTEGDAVMQTITGGMTEKLNGAGEGISQVGGNWMDQLGGGAEANMDKVTGKAGDLVTGFKDKAADKAKDLIPTGKNMDEQIGSGIEKGAKNVQDKAGEVAGKAKSGFKKAVDGASDIGAQATQGFANGIKSKWQEVSRAGTYIGEQALKAAKKALDERSPSHKMFDIGDFATLGFINGGKARSKEVSVAYGSLGLMAMEAIVSAFNNSENVNTGLIPEIKPVLNTSAFEDSLSSLQTMMNGGNIVADGTLVVVQKSPELEELVTLNRQLIDEVRNGHEIYMDGNRLVGYVNRKLGEA